MNADTNFPSQSIRQHFTHLRSTSKARHRDIAAQLGISEGELIAAHVGLVKANSAEHDGAEAAADILQARRLRAEWPDIMAALEPLGEVMALTRNGSCVHEKTGVYRNVSHQHHVGLVLGGAIDLRVFYRHWAHGFAVSEETANGTQRSLQFFDASGTAIHKIFLQSQSNLQAFSDLVEHFADADQSPNMCAQASAARAAEVADTEVDVADFRRAWDSLRDTHEFVGLLKRFDLTRTQALRLADRKYVQQVEVEDCQSLLQAAAAEGLAIMVFVGNPGMIQIHSGPITKLMVMGPWLNVLDPGFNLHLREDHIASAWIVKKPTVDGLVTSFELFDAQGDTIAMFFGARKPGQREQCEWRALIDTIQEEPSLCAA